MAKAHTLVDNFNDNAVDLTKWTLSGGDAIREVNRRVEIRPPSNEPGTYTYNSVAYFDLTESEMRVELEEPLRAAPGVMSGMAAQAANGEYIAIWVENDQIEAVQGIGGVVTQLEQVPYDPVAHRWLRMRERAGTTFWEVSPDGVEWAILFRGPDPLPLTAVRALIGVRVQTVRAAPGFAVLDNFNVQETGITRRLQERRLSARAVRVQAADIAANREHDDHANNNDEVNYPATPLAGNYSKGLRHDDLGDPDPASYATLLRALESRDPADFAEIQLGQIGQLKLTNPQAGLAFDLEGPDAQALTMPPAPRFDSVVTSHEAGELYWMAVARDVPFISYPGNAIIADAVVSMNDEFPQFGGTVPVTPGNIFRGVFPGEQVGPYVSQFLVKGNVDQRKPAGQGRDAADGFISYGSRTIDQRQFSAVPGLDYIDDFQTWVDFQNGYDGRGGDQFETTKRFIRDLRGGATFVHFDQVVDAFYNAAWLLMSEPRGNQSTFVSGTTGRPQVDAEFPYNRGNPYMPPMGFTGSPTEGGFATFGPTHLLQAVPEVLGRALRAVWWQKWGVHRRLRPEEFGGRVDNWLAGRRDYGIEPSIKISLQAGGLAEYFPVNGHYLLPQAYSEGAPTHPAFGAGHATGSGAMITILKAFFDDLMEIENPVQPSADGLTLVPYVKPVNEPVMTVGGELNKLAGNIALFRNAAGVHWRSDYTDSLPFGEQIAIGLLQEMSLGFNEDDGFFELTRLDGVRIRIFDGKVVPVVV